MLKKKGLLVGTAVAVLSLVATTFTATSASACLLYTSDAADE